MRTSSGGTGESPYVVGLFVFGFVVVAFFFLVLVVNR
jgi:hypothetical protein